MFGVAAPRFIWVAALVLFLGTLGTLLAFWWVVRREERTYRHLTTQLRALDTADSGTAQDGMTSTLYDSVRQIFLPHAASAPSVVAAWRRFAAQMVRRYETSGQERWWSPESAETMFNDTTVIEPRVNRGLFSAIPGIVTGAGLLCTFIAILVALLDVTLENEQFRGLDALISGLSGKFLSSIAALGGATLYVLGERQLTHRLSQGVYRLAVALDELVPRLTPVRVLLTIQEQMAAQAVALGQANRDLATTLGQSMREGLGPTLERLVQTVEDMTQGWRTVETQRAEATTGSLEGLLQQLGQSLQSSLGTMSERFSQTLSHNATHEFESVASALNGSARLLADMNTQFLATQGALSSVVELAKQSTTEQMSLGKTQVEDLTTVLREMMTQMHDSAGLSVQRMSATLTAVVHDLSTQVTAMSERMGQAVTANASQASDAAQAMMGHVDQWSTHSTQQLAQLIERHQAHLERVQDVQRTMDTTLGQFKSALSEYATVTSGLKNISAQTTTMVTAATGAIGHLKDTGTAIERVAQQVTAQAERLGQANRQQEEVQQRLAVNLQRYQQVFREVEGAAGQLLEQIEQHLRRYMTTTQQGFERLTEAADGHFANAARHLGETVNGLDEHLQDLTDILERLGRGAR